MAVLYLHVLTLWNIAVAHPLLSVLGRHVEFLVAHRAEPTDVVLFVLVVCLLLPAVGLGVLGALGSVAPAASRTLGRVALGGLAGLVALVLLGRLAPPPLVLLAAATVAGVVAAIGAAHVAAVRLFLTALSPALVAVPALFLLAAPVQKVLRPPSVAAVPPRDGRAAPVVLVIFDALSTLALLDANRSIDAVRYPHFAALARQATWFRQATTVADDTTAAVPAILTGRYPVAGALPIAGDHPQSLFTLLAATHDMRVFEPLTRLCPPTLCRGRVRPTPRTRRLRALLGDAAVVYAHVVLPAPLTARLPDVTRRWAHFADASDAGALSGDRAEYFARFVASIAPAPGPRLYLLHLMLPHWPYHYLPSGQLYGWAWDQPGLRAGRWIGAEPVVREGHRRYLLQVGFVDRLLGRLVARLRAVGLWDRALVVVTADHGASFRVGDRRRAVSEGNFADVMRVPLLVKGPHQQEGVVSDRNVETIDVLPTIAAVLGVSIPHPVDGTSALEPTTPARARKVVFERAGGRRELDPTAPEWDGALSLQLARFGSRTPLDASGPTTRGRALIGRRVADVGVVGGPRATVELDLPPAMYRVAAGHGFVPARVSGWVSGDPPPDLAVAVNGVICAVAPADTESTLGTRFDTMVPESVFGAGENTVEVLAVAADGRHLAPTRRRPPRRYRLGDAEATLRADDGRVVPVTAGAVEGYVDHVEHLGDFLRVAGWAVDVGRGAPATTVVAFRGREFLFAGRPNTRRSDVAAAHRDIALEGSGFTWAFPWEHGDPKGVLRVFGVSAEGRASELAPSAR